MQLHSKTDRQKGKHTAAYIDRQKGKYAAASKDRQTGKMDQLEQTDRLVTCSGIHKTNRSSGIHRQTGRQQAAMKVTRIKKENVDTSE